MFLLLMRMRGGIERIERIEWCCEEGRSNLIVPVSDSVSGRGSGRGRRRGSDTDSLSSRWRVGTRHSSFLRECERIERIERHRLNRHIPSTHITSYLIEL